MGDMGEIFNAWKDHRKEQRSAEAAKAPDQVAALERLGYTVIQLSPNGPHLRIDAAFDYWPSTGRWRALRGKAKGNGFASLCGALKRNS